MPVSSFPPSRRALMALFFASGFIYALWGVHVPLIKAKFHFSDSQLAWALFSVAGGAILAMGPLGRWTSRVGSARACVWGGMWLAASAVLLMLMPAPVWLFAALLAFGAANSLFDVAMNAQASLLERQQVRPLMSSLHGLFSVGGLGGALAGSAWQATGWPSSLLFALSAGGVLLAIRLGQPHFLPETASSSTAPTAVGHRGMLLALGGLAFIGLVAEGGMYDWSSLYMQEAVGLSAAWIGLGYGGFSLGMTLGRFGGDSVRRRWGSLRVLQASGLLAGAGVVLAIVWPSPLPVVTGFLLVGLGCANFMPVLMSHTAALPGIPTAEALARVGRLAYLGLLIGPVLIGVTTDHAGLPAGFGLIGLGALFIGLWARRLLGPSGPGPAA